MRKGKRRQTHMVDVPCGDCVRIEVEHAAVGLKAEDVQLGVDGPAVVIRRREFVEQQQQQNVHSMSSSTAELAPAAAAPHQHTRAARVVSATQQWKRVTARRAG